MVKVEFTADNPLLQELAALAKQAGVKGALPVTEAAFANGAKKIAGAWRAYGAKKQSIDGVEDMKKPSKSYSAGVQITQDGDFSYTIENTSKAAATLEYGMTGYDMKQTHPYGAKSRVGLHWNKQSKMMERVPYLIVPFSWGRAGTVQVSTQNTMTEDIDAIAKRLKKSRVMEEVHFEDNYAGQAVQRREYKWADRLKNDKENDYGNANGMVRMDDTAGKGKGSTYFTFRIISARSPQSSWLHKGISARHVTEGLQKQYGKEIEQDIQEAMKKDFWG